MLGLGRRGTATRGQYNAPTDTFATKDGFLTVQIVGGSLFKRWANLMGEESWCEDERFNSDQSRGDHGEIICERMAAWCAQRSSADALQELAEAGIPVGEMLQPAEVLNNEHVTEAALFQAVDYPGAQRPAMIADHPIRYSKTQVQNFKRAPTLGEHTGEILREIGYNNDEITQLKSTGAI